MKTVMGANSHRHICLLLAACGMALVIASSGEAQVTPSLFLLELDHLKCYQVVKDPNQGVANVDLASLQFLGVNKDTGRESGCKVDLHAQMLCIPTAKEYVDGKPVGDDPLGKALATNFLCYKATCPNNPVRQVSVVDQFGQRVVSVQNAQLLCAPAVSPIPSVSCDYNHPPMCGGFCAPGTSCQSDPLSSRCQCK
jgi:hypothetical protein